MPLKTLLKRKDKAKDDAVASTPSDPEPPEFVIMRSDTTTQEILQPPSSAGAPAPQARPKGPKRLSRFRALSDASAPSRTSSAGEKRLSQRLHLRSHSRASSAGSVNVPTDLPRIDDAAASGEEKEAKWEERATILAKANPNAGAGVGGGAPDWLPAAAEGVAELSVGGEGEGGGRPVARRALSDAQGDVWDADGGRWRDWEAEADPGGRKISKRLSDYTKPGVCARAGHIMMSQLGISWLLMSVCVISRSRPIDCHVWSPGGPEKRPEPGPLRSRAPARLGHHSGPELGNHLSLAGGGQRRRYRIAGARCWDEEGRGGERGAGVGHLRAGELLSAWLGRGKGSQGVPDVSRGGGESE